jgi:hypothetical protein
VTLYGVIGSMAVMAVGGGATGLLLAAGDAPTDMGGGLLGGGVGGLITGGGAIFFLIRRHDTALEKKDEKHDAAIKDLTTKFEAMLTKKDEQIVGIVNKFDGALREMREENQRNVERQFEHSKEVVAALEHVNTSLHELSGRVDALDGSKSHGSLPSSHPPGQSQKPPGKRPPGFGGSHP